MGGSMTARYADGGRLFGARAAWPETVLRAWPRVAADAAARCVAAHAARGRPVPAARASVAPSDARRVPVPLRQVLRDGSISEQLERLARETGMDEAELAQLWPPQATGDVEAARLVRETACRVKDLEEAVLAAIGEALGDRRRVPRATRLAVRTELVHRLAPRPGRPEPDIHWDEQERVRRFILGLLRPG